MKNTKKQAFTLVELLVVITILAIISVVAYQSFWGATDKAVWARKISDVATIESSLQQYKIDKKFYPKVDEYSSTGSMWGYSTSGANPSNTLTTTKNGDEITAISNAWGGGRVMWIDTYSTKQVWAKWVISQNTLWKKFLTKDLYDPELWDVKVWTEKMIDKWIGRYVYAVYKKPLSADTTWSANQKWTYYNIAYTVKKDWWDTYITRISWDYDKESCFDKKDSCPETLIGNGSTVLKDKQENSNSDTSATNQWIPYPVSWY